MYHNEMLQEKIKLQREISLQKKQLFDEKNNLELSKRNVLELENDLHQKKEMQDIELQAGKEQLSLNTLIWYRCRTNITRQRVGYYQTASKRNIRKVYAI